MRGLRANRYSATRIFTTSARLRLHTWRLGLTALILKNCRSSRSLLPPTAVPDPFPLLPPSHPPQPFARPRPTSPSIHPPKTKLRRFALLGIKSWVLLGMLTHPSPFTLPHLSDNRRPRHPMLKHARVFSPFARSSIARPGLG